MRASIDSFPLGLQERKWSEALEVLALQCVSSPDEVGASEVDILRSPSGALAARLRSSLSLIRQESRPGSRSGGKSLFLVFHCSGSGQFVDGSSFREDDISICDRSANWAMEFSGEVELLFLEVSKERLFGRFGRVPLPLVLDTTISVMAARTSLRTFATEFDNLQASDLLSAEVAVSEFVASALAQGGVEDAGRPTQVQAAHFQRVTAAIELGLAQTSLSMTEIARHENLSPRYLQKLFALHDDTFSEYLRRRRLDCARHDLVAPQHQARSIAEIAFGWGFRSASHFSRAFKETYGVSPRAYRRTGGPSREDFNFLRGRPPGRLVQLRNVRPDAEAVANADRLSGAVADTPSNAHAPADRTSYHLPVGKETVHWGYLSHALRPVLQVPPGAEVVIETLTQHATDDWERMIAGDRGAESVFQWTPQAKAVDRRGAGPMDASIFGRGAGEGFGVHILTGPVHIEGAEPGDILEVQIIDIEPRPSANPKFRGRCFASNVSTWWGYQYSDFIDDTDRREIVTIFEVVPGSEFARALYSYRWTPQVDPFGTRHDVIDYPGVPVDHSTVTKRHDVLRNVSIPLRPHFGCMAVAPRETGLVDSIPPGNFGGNLDNWRAGKGSTFYLPVSVPGALFSVGDGHLALGDGEVDGTALECSLTGTFRFELHKKNAPEKPYLRGLACPLLETPDEFILHGFSYPNYLRDLGCDAQAEVYRRSSLSRALRSAYRATRKFLIDAWNFDEDEANTMMSIAVDFAITQVADGNWGVHSIIRKEIVRDAGRS